MARPMKAGRPTVAERNERLTSAVARAMRDLDAMAVMLLLRVPNAPVLDPVVIAMTPLGTGPVEEVLLEDDLFASAEAYESGRVATAQSIDILMAHPELSAFAPFPYVATAAPVFSGTQRFGTLTAFWLRPYGDPDEWQSRTLREAADGIADELRRLADSGVSLVPPKVPNVVPGQEWSEDGRAAASVAPFLYHVHKLAIRLTGATDTRTAVDMAMERLLSGFHGRAVAITVLAGRSLRVVGASGCSSEFLRTLNRQPWVRGTPEGDAIDRPDQQVFRHDDPRVRGRLSDPEAEGDVVWVVMPLLVGKRAVGTCSIAFGTDRGDLAAERSALSSMATLLGQSFERTRMLDGLHAMTGALQRTLLPRILEPPAGLSSASRYMSATTGIEIGGDWYDLIRQPGGNVTLVIGDVEGHNISAAVVMGQLRSAMRAYAAEGHDPGTLLARTSQLLANLDTGLFATCCCVSLNVRSGIAEIASAGHQIPLIRTLNGRYPAVDPEVGVPLGVEADPLFPVRRLTLEPGTLLVFYTDGLAAAHGGELSPRAVEQGLAADGGLEALCDHLTRAPHGHTTWHKDDAALLLVRYEGPLQRGRPRAAQGVRS